MSHDPVLMMLGLARRAGKLALGDELVREACGDKKARCVLVAADAGTSTAKKAAFYAERANVPLVPLPHDKDSLGAAIGKNGCALCAVTDIGLAAAAVRHLAAQDARYAVVSAQLDEKNERIQSRKGKKKPKNRQKENQPAEKPQQRQRTDDKPRRFTGERRYADDKPRRFTGERRHADDKPRKFTRERRHADDKPGQSCYADNKPRRFTGESRYADDKPRKFTGQSRKPNEKPHAKRVFNRKSPRRMTER